MSYDPHELGSYCDRCDRPMPLRDRPGDKFGRLPPPNPLFAVVYMRGPRDRAAAAVPFGDLEFCDQCLPQLAEALTPLISAKSKARTLAARGGTTAPPPYKVRRSTDND